jgi:hypothetical protein
LLVILVFTVTACGYYPAQTSDASAEAEASLTVDEKGEGCAGSGAFSCQKHAIYTLGEQTFVALELKNNLAKTITIISYPQCQPRKSSRIESGSTFKLDCILQENVPTMTRTKQTVEVLYREADESANKTAYVEVAGTAVEYLGPEGCLSFAPFTCTELGTIRKLDQDNVEITLNLRNEGGKRITLAGNEGCSATTMAVEDGTTVTVTCVRQDNALEGEQTKHTFEINYLTSDSTPKTARVEVVATIT